MKELRHFLGLPGYYRHYNSEYINITHTLTHLLRNDTQYNWTESHQRAFTEHRRCLQSPSIVVYSDPSKPCYLFTDASGYCWGITLCQCTSQSGSLHDLKPVQFVSGKFSDMQCNYATLVREAFAMHIPVQKLGSYLQDSEYTMCYDYKPLEKSLKGKAEKIKSQIHQ